MPESVLGVGLDIAGLLVELLAVASPIASVLFVHLGLVALWITLLVESVPGTN